MMYHIYDSEGYYAVSVDADVKPENSTTIEPDLQPGYWSRFDGTKWDNEKIPETVEDIIGLSFPVPPSDPMEEDPTPQHQSILRSMCDRIMAGDPHARKQIADGIITIISVSDEQLAEEEKEKLFASLREKRDAKLAETDFYLTADYPIDADKLEAVKTYRQALRDLPSQEGAPWDGGEEETPWPVFPNIK